MSASENSGNLASSELATPFDSRNESSWSKVPSNALCNHEGRASTGSLTNLFLVGSSDGFSHDGKYWIQIVDQNRRKVGPQHVVENR